MFKQIRTPLLAATALVLCSGAAQAAELTMNGGFETGDFTGWTVFDNGGATSVTTVNPSAGIYEANLIADGGPFNPLIKNANIGIGQVSANEMVTVSVDMRGTAATGGVGFIELFSELSGGGVSGQATFAVFPDANPDVWTTFVFDVTLGPDVSGGVTLQLVSVCGADPGCVSNLFWDNASVRTSAVPVPAALWLFGSALGLLGWKRRKA